MTEEEKISRWNAAQERCFLIPEPGAWSVEATLRYLDKAGVAMQLLSNIPQSLPALKASNDYGASLVGRYPSRFGLLAALPTDDAAAALAEIQRATAELAPDGFAVTCCYNDVYLDHPALDVVWEELNRLEACVFIHPNAYAAPKLGRPAPLVEVAFETCRTVVSMLYTRHFQRFPNVKFIVSHCGGSLPVLASRLELLGAEAWVPNPRGIASDDIKTQLSTLYLDTAATCPSGLGPAIKMTCPSHIVYGTDCGVPCSTDRTMDANKRAILQYDGLSPDEIQAIGTNVLALFPTVAARVSASKV
ncbi:hypothetical protein A1O3_10123 [Capronia epimyces CBS 606.96]|uniref:Amidohydrolase-related domain-containing protein n=1 Tax=Capronia epimyces CBS 606.96 TaxID=1182542 RepID=W9XJ24_9EURO|nr:uncharacterized protein A1O3_10123 [Capronia epimyces CBS 606.96]EXJ76966.1 hypothetical protein A1O3_10123 [Capronia epimyces CBS 606.96]